METDFISIPLYEHQKTSIQDMENLEKKCSVSIDSETTIETRIGILADLPGYGKTLSVIGLIGKTRFDQEEDHYFKEKKEISNFVSKIKIKRLDQLSVSLILVNVSLLSQWISELSRSTLRYIAIYNRADIEGIDMNKYDLILVGNNIYNLFCQVYRNKCWKRFIIDEPASLKIISMEETTAKFYWLVTATPYELYPRKRSGFLNDMLPEMELIHPVILKNDDQYVKISYDMPITNHIYYKITSDISKIFEGLVNQNTMEMLEAGNISGVLTLLGSTTERESIIDAFRNRKTKRLTELKCDEENIETIEKIQLIKDHLHLLDDRLREYALNQLCILCNKPHQGFHIFLCCQTIFCGSCILNDSCSICKTATTTHIPVKIDDLPDYNPEEITSLQHLTKIQQTMNIISDACNKKILIFSNFNESFTIIKKFLEEKRIHYLELRGTKEKRDNTIDLYKTGHVNVLLLNTIHSGAGLNLQETTDIIMYHRLHDYQKTQVLGRANRIGRKMILNVHYLE